MHEALYNVNPLILTGNFQYTSLNYLGYFMGLSNLIVSYPSWGKLRLSQTFHKENHVRNGGKMFTRYVSLKVFTEDLLHTKGQ